MTKKKNHAGQKLDKEVRASGLSITLVTRRAGFSRRTYYLHITKEYLPADTLRAYSVSMSPSFPPVFDRPENRLPTPFEIKAMSLEELIEEMKKMQSKCDWLEQQTKELKTIQGSGY